MGLETAHIEEHPGQLKIDFNDIPNHEYKRPTFEEEYINLPGERAVSTGNGIEVVTHDMREWFYEKEGYMAYDNVILKAWKKKQEKKAKKNKSKKHKVDGGGGQNYYDLPPNSKQLLDLIEYRNMNGNIKDIFKACFRLGEKPGVTEEYDVKKMVLYSIRELGRLLGRKDYVQLAREVVGHHDKTEADRLESLTN